MRVNGPSTPCGVVSLPVRALDLFRLLANWQPQTQRLQPTICLALNPDGLISARAAQSGEV